MVTFKLVGHDEKYLEYDYFPEDRKEKQPGRIKVDQTDYKAYLIEVAEEDWECVATVAEMRAMREAMNEMSKECGEEMLTDENFPIPEEDIRWYVYAGHAIKAIKDGIKKREILEDGTVMWY